jgi:acetylornithine aminotransferase
VTNPTAVRTAAATAGYLVNAVEPDTIRVAPPFVVTKKVLLAFADALPGLLCQT